jgi:hypothetical protein
MAPLAKKLNKKLNYADYLTWPDDERWEIIEGVAYDMSPAPSTEHQDISFKLSGAGTHRQAKQSQRYQGDCFASLAMTGTQTF